MTVESPADWPHWDESHADTLVDTEDVYVEIESVLADDGSIEIRRSVSRKARRRVDRHILWIGTVAVISRGDVPEFVRDIVTHLT